MPIGMPMVQHRLYHARCICIAFLLALFVKVCAFAHIPHFSFNVHCVVIYRMVLQCCDTCSCAYALSLALHCPLDRFLKKMLFQYLKQPLHTILMKEQGSSEA